MLLTALLILSSVALPEGVVEKVAGRRIFFGHQSVGANVVDGIRELTSGKLIIREGRSFTSPGLLHAFIGKNEAPLTKLADFESIIEALDGQVDLAFFKFCYIDFNAHTDVERLFTEYLATLNRLRAKYPGVTFVHVTVPLTVVPQGPKAWLQKTLTRSEPWGTKENAVRQRFNTLLRTRLEGQPLFDLAALESTHADGTPVRYPFGAQSVPALAPEYSNDGQHLNATGRRVVAEALLTFLARLP